MKYSAGIVSHTFWFYETKITAELMLEGYSKKEILEKALDENIYQVDTERRIKRMVSVIHNRLNGLSEELLQYFVNCDVYSAKLFVFITIIMRDKLFFEFMHEVFREHIILGDYNFKKSDFDSFFINKAAQSEIVASWTERSIKRLPSTYRLMMFEAGLIDSKKPDSKIIPPLIDFNLKDLFKKHELMPFINVFTGE